MKYYILAKSYDLELKNLLTTKEHNGIIHSVFNNVFNIKLHTSKFDSKLISVIIADGKYEFNQPGGILVDFNKKFTASGIKPSTEIVVKFPEIFHSKFLLDLSNATEWHEKFDSGCGKHLPQVEVIYNMINSKKARTLKYKNLIYKLANSNKFDKIIGLGDGLTPAGDDFLVGMLNCSYYLQHFQWETNSRATNFVSLSFIRNCEILIQTIRQYKNKTNDISRSFIEYALEGRISQRAIDLMNFCCSQNVHYKAQKNFMFLNYGHNSGYYHLLGVLYVLERFFINFTKNSFKSNKPIVEILNPECIN
ncbi:MAG: DUF2877 domain-containing protein [Elusimicrobiota bacterium]|nr:DUF2877 domain-containing protein [Elusimicrobiota bacterium]